MPRAQVTAEPLYPYHEWEITETIYSPEYNARHETIFALGNGYLGTRGTPEEGGTVWREGTYINGFYESAPLRYPEWAYGFAENSQTMLNVTNGKVIRLFVGADPFDLQTGTVLEYRCTLDLRAGCLTRDVVWRSPGGIELRVMSKRLVSFTQPHLLAIQWQVTLLNAPAALHIVSALDGDVSNDTTEKDPRAGSGLQGRALLTEALVSDEDSGWLWQHTARTGFWLACAMHNIVEADTPVQRSNASGAFTVEAHYTMTAQPSQTVTLSKFAAYVTSFDYPDKPLPGLALGMAQEAAGRGFAALEQEQRAYLDDFWARADVEIAGDAALQQGIRFNMFHLLQAAGKDGRTNIAAKGLTGEGYEGHIFWDTEMYVVPFFLYHSPEIARKLLEHRYRLLDKARERARQMGHERGALFAWRTINGEECSAYYPAGTAQYHINADIAYAIRQLLAATGDEEFLRSMGAEILFETARLWVGLGAYVPHKGGAFCINGVTGPDEYTAVVNNNAYTNWMAQLNLRYAAETAEWLRREHPAAYAQLAERIGLAPDEVADWTRAADAMYIARDEGRGIYLQDDSFLDKAPWDFANTPPEKYPLLLHFHPLVIYRHQVCKQADLVLALFLLDQHFTLDEKRRNYDFYEPLTTHDSSLSACIFSIVASQIGYHEKAYDYFMSTARMDLDDQHHNVKDGVHIANMAGTWMGVIYGFAGMRVRDGVLTFAPYLPPGWESYRFRLAFQGRRLRVSVDGNGVGCELLSGAPLTVQVNGREVLLEA